MNIQEIARRTEELNRRIAEYQSTMVNITAKPIYQIVMVDEKDRITETEHAYTHIAQAQAHRNRYNTRSTTRKMAKIVTVAPTPR